MAYACMQSGQTIWSCMVRSISVLELTSYKFVFVSRIVRQSGQDGFVSSIKVYRVLISHIIIIIVLHFTCILVYLVSFCTVLCRVVEITISA